jgi:predicted TPR repeat methyltransferase
MVWRLEQRALETALRESFPGRRPTHLDFACGTGRILEFFAGRVASSTGVDVSASMMEVARSSAPEAELIEADLTQHDALGDRRFDLITAFRFFPNAETELREGVFRVLGRHLAPGGVLIFNNHKNGDSVRGRMARLRGRGSRVGTMTHKEVERLLPVGGLRILRRTPIATLPLSEKHVLVPVAVAEPLERLLSALPVAAVAQDILYVCGRADRP